MAAPLGKQAQGCDCDCILSARQSRTLQRLGVRFVDHWLYSKEPLPPFKISGILFYGCSQLHFVK